MNERRLGAMMEAGEVTQRFTANEVDVEKLDSKILSEPETQLLDQTLNAKGYGLDMLQNFPQKEVNRLLLEWKVAQDKAVVEKEIIKYLEQ